jgi:AcrR family transcriptional regulator
MTSTSDTGRPAAAPTLRTRKRLRTRRELQRAAIRLVEQNGYENTAVEDICAEAEVSRSTFFRYFGTKAAIFEADLIEEMASDGRLDIDEYTLATLCEGICATYRELTDEQFDQERRRIHLLQTVPELRASFASELVRPLPMLITFAARMLGLPPDAQRVRTIAGVVFGALGTMQLPDSQGNIELPATKDAAIAMFEATFADLALVVNIQAHRSQSSGQERSAPRAPTIAKPRPQL